MKKLFGGFIAIAMLVFPPMAGGAKAETQMQPESYPCEVCGIGRVLSHEEHEAWRLDVYQFACSHRFPEGHDVSEICDVYTVRECDSCAFSSDAYTGTRFRLTCFGSDR